MLQARVFTDSVRFVDISGFRAGGIHMTVTPGWEYVPCDVAITYGLANPIRKSRQGLLRNAIHGEHKGPIVVIESSLIGRSFKQRLPRWLSALRRRPLRPRQVHPYYRVAVGGALGDDADFGAKNSPPDRWERMKAEFGIELKPYRTAGHHIVVIGQMPMDASLKGVDVGEWLHDTVAAIRRISERPILVRLHPSTRWSYRERVQDGFAGMAGVTMSSNERSLADDLAGAWTCVTLSSGSAIDALIEGIPPICLSPASLAYRICSREITEIDEPKRPEREQFMRDLAYSQWSLKEIADGTAWQHILPVVLRALGDKGRGLPSGRPAIAPSHGNTAGRSRLLPRFGPRLSIDHRDRNTGDWKRSLGIWSTLAILSPDSRSVLLGRGKALFNLARYREAAVSFAHLRRSQPRLAVAHEGFARSSEKLGHWNAALEAWTDGVRLHPDRIVPLRGRAKALENLGLDDEAEAAFVELCSKHPSEPSGFRGLARMAERRGDWSRALGFDDELWSRFADPDGIRRKLLTLIRMERIDEARSVVAALEPPAASLATYLSAAVPLHEHLHEWPQMERLLREYEEDVRADIHLVKAYVTMLIRFGRSDEAIALIQRSTGGSSIGRSNLLASTLIHARRYDEADACLLDLMADSELNWLSVELLAPLVNAAWETGGSALALKILDRIERDAPISRQGEVLRLLAPFQRTRLEALGGLAASPPSLHRPAVCASEAVASFLDRRPLLPPTMFNYPLARELCATVDWQAAEGATVVPDPSYDLGDALEVACRIVEAVDAGEPLSLIRLGDGEGAILPYRPELASLQASDMAATLRTWWAGVSEAEATSIVPLLREACRSAEIVGVPDFCRAAITLLNNAVGDTTKGSRNARGLLATMDFAKHELAARVPVLTSCHIHQSLAHWALWDVLLPRLGPLSLITCHANLPEVLAQRFCVETRDLHVIPPENRYGAAFADTRQGRHFPDVFEQMRVKLKDVGRGDVFLVAAGVLGKIYCMWIRQAGGIAIDIGSAADFWCGYETRGIADGGTYRTPTGVAERVRMLVADHPRFGVLAGARCKAEAALFAG